MIILSKGKPLRIWSNVTGVMTLHEGKNNAQKFIRIHLKLTSEDGKKQFIVSLDKYEIKKLKKFTKKLR